jgi:hypothetical protein
MEVANVMALLGVEPSDEHKAVLRGLGNGECIFRDLDGRAGRIGIDLISDDLRRRLDTNPTRAKPEVPVPPAPPVPPVPPVPASVAPPGTAHNARPPTPQPAASHPPAG